LEVVFIVIAVGATGNMLVPANVGALAAGLLVILLGVLLHRPLSLVPENTLKFAVGILLSAFGTFWIGEGLRFTWVGQDWAIVCLVLGFLLAAFVSINLAKGQLVSPSVLRIEK
jgi:Ca2+/H+ antiporter, TMEM165/GDT1 family